MALLVRGLSHLELQILWALAHGLPSKEIAKFVGRRKPTIEGYVRQLCRKFSARSRTHLVAMAFCQGTLRSGPSINGHDEIALASMDGAQSIGLWPTGTQPVLVSRPRTSRSRHQRGRR